MRRIRRLDVQGFRGICPKVSLLFEAKSLLLFGENGTCKSSFVDALEKVLTGKVSTLDGRAVGLSSDRHGPHIRSAHHPTEITIVFDDADATTLSMPPKGEPATAALQQYVSAAKADPFI